MDQATEDFIEEYVNELNEDNASVFIGAGLSKSAGYVDWSGLLAPIARRIGLDASKEPDLVRLAQYYFNSTGDRAALSQTLVRQFSDLRAPTEAHEILARLPIRTYWTSNYDRMIETAIELSGKRVDTKYTSDQFATTKPGRDAVVYKMHGDIEQPSNAILTRDDYERYHRTHPSFVTALMGDLVEKTFLFLGFSFTDPNLDYVLAQLRINLGQNAKQHYCITRRLVRTTETEEEFRYAETKQALFAGDLSRLKIKTLYVDSFDKITGILRAIERRYRRQTIFVSGSAHEYGKWGERAAAEFLARLGRVLISMNFRIATGFGLGVGPSIVTGAIQEIYSSSQRSIQQQLILRPFPIGIQDAEQRQQTFRRFRKELTTQAGISVFLLGNRSDSGVVSLSQGVRDEFAAADSTGSALIPVGASEYMSRQLWNEVRSDFNRYFPHADAQFSELFEQLGAPTDDPMTLLEPLIAAIKILARA